jgi:hypothetical protein
MLSKRVSTHTIGLRGVEESGAFLLDACAQCCNNGSSMNFSLDTPGLERLGISIE